MATLNDLLTSRIPPNNLAAERAVLGAMMLERELPARVMDRLRQTHFYKEGHRKIYAAMETLFKRGDQIDLLLVVTELQRESMLEEIGGAAYLAGIVDEATVATNVEEYTTLVIEQAKLRQLIATSTETIGKAYEAQDSVADIVGEAIKTLFLVSEGQTERSTLPISTTIVRVFRDMLSTSQDRDVVTGIATGIADLDTLTTGFQDGDLVLVAGRPSMGKTSNALTIARHAAVENGKRVLIFSLEMPREQLVQRLLAMEGNVDFYKLRRPGAMDERDIVRVVNAAGRLSRASIYIDDTSMTLMAVYAAARRIKAEVGVDLILIDYIQLMNSGDRRSENRQQEIASISKALKQMAKELRVPVVALSQLSRAIEQREIKEPQLSDLRDSGSLEQDADIVIFVHRPAKYEGSISDESVTYAIVAKQRNGPTGMVMERFVGEICQFVGAGGVR